MLDADDGAYVVPVDDRLGFAETALTEPWACVEAAYTQRRRLVPAVGGRTWVIGQAEDAREYRFGDTLAGAREIVVSELRDEVISGIRAGAPGALITVAEIEQTEGPFDDVILLGPRSAHVVSRAADALAFRGVLNLVGKEPLDGPVDLDIGRIHYHYTAYVGSTGPDVANSYGEARNRAELLRVGASQLTAGMERERRRMAMDLHDAPSRIRRDASRKTRASAGRIVTPSASYP